MIDPRFYESLGPIPAGALWPAEKIAGDPDALVSTVAPADEAGPEALCYLDGAGDAQAGDTQGIAFARAPAAGRVRLLDPAPRAAFSRTAARLVRPRGFAPDAPAIDPSALIEEGARLARGVIVGAGAQIGARAEIGPNSVIGPGVAIGRGTRIGANCVILFALIGDDVTILSGSVVGEQGFGVAGDAGGLVDVPQFGRVIIQDRATIGALSSVDRGAFADTIVGEETKIDNHCHLGHNVVAGRQVVIAAYGGISGSVTIGDGVRMGGRVGVADHKTIGAGASLAAGSAVLHDVPAGETWAGYPAKPFRAWARETAWLRRRAADEKGGGKE